MTISEHERVQLLHICETIHGRLAVLDEEVDRLQVLVSQMAAIVRRN